MTGQFFEDFHSSSNNFATTSLRIPVVGFFTFRSPNLALFVKKGPLKFSDLKIVTERGIGKSYVVVNL